MYKPIILGHSIQLYYVISRQMLNDKKIPEYLDDVVVYNHPNDQQQLPLHHLGDFNVSL